MSPAPGYDVIAGVGVAADIYPRAGMYARVRAIFPWAGMPRLYPGVRGTASGYVSNICEAVCVGGGTSVGGAADIGYLEVRATAVSTDDAYVGGAIGVYLGMRATGVSAEDAYVGIYII